MKCEPDMPPGWAWARVDEVGSVQLGRQRAPQHHSGPNMRPYLRVANVYEGRLDLSSVLEMNFDPDEYETYRLEPEDILLNEGQSLDLVGRPAMYRGEIPGACFQNTLVRFRASKCVYPSYALVVFMGYLHTGRFQRIARWTTNIAHLGASRFGALKFPLPPLAEQHRIVAEIETQFARLDAGVAALKRAQANLKRCRAAVLRAACEGRLVPTEAELAQAEGREYEPAAVLLERAGAQGSPPPPDSRAIGVARRSRRPTVCQGGLLEASQPGPACLCELPEGWVWSTVGQVGARGEQPVLTGPFGTGLGRADFAAEGIPVITIGCLTEYGITLEKAAFVSEAKAADLSRYRLRPGDFLFSRMASVGRAGIVTESLAGALINYHVMRLRLSTEALLPGYFLAYVRGSTHVDAYVREVNHGATRDGINTEQLLAMPVAVPPLAEQRRIVAEVERRLSIIAETEAVVAANLKRAERLRQAILKQAFEGKLVPQDPSDEPASVLLARIRAAREAGGPARAPRRGGRRGARGGGEARQGGLDLEG